MNVKRTPMMSNGTNPPTPTGEPEVGVLYYFRGKSEGIGLYNARLGNPSRWFQGAKGVAQRVGLHDVIEPVS
jgi:hypothetical protein